MAEPAAPKMAEDDLLRMTAEVVAAYVSNNTLADRPTGRCHQRRLQLAARARRRLGEAAAGAAEAGRADPQVGHARTI